MRRPKVHQRPARSASLPRVHWLIPCHPQQASKKQRVGKGKDDLWEVEKVLQRRELNGEVAYKVSREHAQGGLQGTIARS